MMGSKNHPRLIRQTGSFCVLRQLRVMLVLRPSYRFQCGRHGSNGLKPSTPRARNAPPRRYPIDATASPKWLPTKHAKNPLKVVTASVESHDAHPGADHVSLLL